MPVTLSGATNPVSMRPDLGPIAASAGKIEPLSMLSFKKSVLQSKGSVVVEFMHPACPHCQATEPMLKETARKMTDKRFLQVDLSDDSNMQLAQAIGITGWPTFIFFQDGKNVGAVFGQPADAADLQGKVKSAYSKPRT